MSLQEKNQRNQDGFKKVVGRKQNKTSLDQNKYKENKVFVKKEFKEKQEKKDIDPSKPFCKVCKDSGKTEDEYTSHFVRESASPDAVVVCPTLLSQACRYCRKDGHTVRYCPSLSGKFSVDRKFKSNKFSNDKKKVLNSESQSKSNQHSSDNLLNVKSTNKQFVSTNLFEYLRDNENENDNDNDNDNEDQFENTSNKSTSVDAKKQWEQLHSGKTLNYGDLKVKCVEGKLVFEVVDKANDTKTPQSSKPSWAQIASNK